MILNITEELENQRIDKILSNKFNISRSKIINSKIYINDKLVKYNTKAKIGDIVSLELEKEEEFILKPNDIEIKVMYEDEYLAVIDKPYNLVVHPSNSYKGDTLVGALLNKFENLSDIGENRNGIVHRLDKDTSGLLIIAKDNKTHIALQEMFKEHKLKKIYLAIIKGEFKEDEIKVSSYIGRDKKDGKKISENTNNGKLAISYFKKISTNNGMSLVSVRILTGRTHQIRVHTKKLGYSILGDKLYSRKASKDDRQQLHSYILEFIHPITNELIYVKSDIPDDMQKNIEKYKLGDKNVGI